MEGYRIIENHSSHNEMVNSTVKQLLCSEDYSDITIASDDGSSFPAHRFILDAYSPTIKSLGKKMEQQQQHKIMMVFTGTSRKTIQYILTYIYKGEVKVREEDCAELYKFANFMKVKGFEGKQFKVEEARREEHEVTRGRLAADQICANMFQLPGDNSNCPPVSRQSTSPYLPHSMMTPNLFGQSVLNNLAMGGNLFPLSSAINSPLKPPMMRSPKPASTPRRDNFPNHLMNGVRSSKSPEEILLGNASIDFSKTANDARISPINPSLHSLVSVASTLPHNFASQIQQMAQQQSFNRSRSRSPVGSIVPSKVEAEDEPVDVQGVEDESEDHESSVHSRSDSVNNSNNRSDQNSSSGRETASPRIDVEEPQKMDISSNLCLPTPFNWGSFAHPPGDAIHNLDNPEPAAGLIQQIFSRAQSQPPFQGLYNTLAPSMGLPVFNPATGGLCVSSAGLGVSSAVNLEKLNETVANILHQNSSPNPSETCKKTSKRAGPKPKIKSGEGDGKKYPCRTPGCNRQYASSGNLKRHEKYECQKAPEFVCKSEGCGLKFQHKHSLKIHANSAHRMTIDKYSNLIPILEDPTLMKKGRKPSKLLQKIIREELHKSPNSSLVIDEEVDFLAKEEEPCTKATASVSLGVNAEDLSAAFMRMQQQQQQPLNNSNAVM